jgi:hypothetical protein
MEKSWADERYEEEFEWPLWKLIQARAEEKDISYRRAAEEVTPEYAKGIRIGDIAFEDDLIKSRIAYIEKEVL